MRSVALVGTAHKYQCPASTSLITPCDRFKSYLRSVVHSLGAAALAEEFNTFNLQERGASETVAQSLATEVGVLHLFADPSPGERAKLGVRDVTSIRLEGPEFLANWSSERVEHEIRLAFEKREGYWLARLLEMDAWPVVFVCGSDHFPSFSSLLSRNGITVVEHCADWKPN